MDANAKVKMVSKESLDTFEVIADLARQRGEETPSDAANALATVNTLTGGSAVSKLQTISSNNRAAYRELESEPAIARVVAIDEENNEKTFYISRSTTVPLNGDAKLASYRAPIGRLAAVQVGEPVTVLIAGQLQTFEVVEKTKFNARHLRDGWDSQNTVFDSDAYGLLTVESLRALLEQGRVDDFETMLATLEEGGEEVRIIEGLMHEVRTSMSLRDQPILNAFQDEIFRLSLNSQMMILGPPGTGKTTTLIRRLGQKLDFDALEPEERVCLDKVPEGALPHEQSWLMFTPTDLLKLFVKEAFNREQVPASDQRIKTWESFRNDLAKRVLGVLQSATSKGELMSNLVYGHQAAFLSD